MHSLLYFEQTDCPITDTTVRNRHKSGVIMLSCSCVPHFTKGDIILSTLPESLTGPHLLDKFEK